MHLGTVSRDFLLKNYPRQLEAFGVRFSEGGPHTSRTLMLKEIGTLLVTLPQQARAQEYRDAILVKNVLGKRTNATRRETYERLRTLYGLSSKIPLFSAYRRLLALESESLPLLSLLVAWSRDSLLRGTTSAILNAKPGSEVVNTDLQTALLENFPSHYTSGTITRIAGNAASSWTQSGYLVGRVKKIRQLVIATSATLTLALLLGHVSELRGELLFSSPWCRLLDLSPNKARTLAAQAHRLGFLDFKAIGSVVEITFPKFTDLISKIQ